MSDVQIIWENIFMKLVKTILSTAVVAMAMGGAVVLNPILARATDNPNTVSCVKGEVKQDFTGEWTSRNTVKFSTADGKKMLTFSLALTLCQTITMVRSSGTTQLQRLRQCLPAKRLL